MNKSRVFSKRKYLYFWHSIPDYFLNSIPDYFHWNPDGKKDELQSGIVILSASPESITAHNGLDMRRWPEKQGKRDLCTFPAQLLQKSISSGRSKSLTEEKDRSLAGKGSLGELCSVFGFMERLLCPDGWAPEFCTGSRCSNCEGCKPLQPALLFWVEKTRRHRGRLTSSRGGGICCLESMGEWGWGNISPREGERDTYHCCSASWWHGLCFSLRL